MANRGSGRNETDVIMPVRSDVPWLQASLSSIASQSLQPSGVTVVDDGLRNPGVVADLGKRLFGNRFCFLSNSGRGISAALNTGIRHSSALWIARMDADDIAHPTRLEKQLEFLHGAPDEVLGCGTQCRFISRDGITIGRSKLPTSWETTAARILSRTCFVHPTLVLRREVLLRAPYRSSMDGAEDVDLILRLSETGRVLNLNEVLLDYRLHPAQESFRSRARHTAVQELAIRAAFSRLHGKEDPLETNPGLAERFIDWRLSTPGYVRSRTFLTALRYMNLHLSHFDFKGFARCASVSIESLPLTPSALTIAWRVGKKAGAALLDQDTPFAALNIDPSEPSPCAS